MKPKLVIPIVIAMTLGFVSFSASAFTPSSPAGELVPQLGAMRTVRIDAKTKYVNVTANETVKFEANGNAFAINFADGLSAFDLNRLAPAGVIDHKVTVYIAPNPLYLP
jgi:formylmethanofuran dehydrogenase subunit B